MNELSEKEFKVIFLQELNEIQEKREKWLQKIRKIMFEQNEKFNNKKVETMKNNKTGTV